jgi:hypothetical protein
LFRRATRASSYLKKITRGRIRYEKFTRISLEYVMAAESISMAVANDYL